MVLKLALSEPPKLQLKCRNCCKRASSRVTGARSTLVWRVSVVARLTPLLLAFPAHRLAGGVLRLEPHLAGSAPDRAHRPASTRCPQGRGGSAVPAGAGCGGPPVRLSIS